MPLRGNASQKNAGDKSSPDYWRELKSGDFVSVADTEAFEASLAEEGAQATGRLDYSVGEVRSFALLGPAGAAAKTTREARAELGEYRFIELQKDGSGPLYLVLVDLADGFELRLYFIPTGIESGTRDDYIDRGLTWLFLPPPDPNDFLSSELEYAPYPDVPEIEEHESGSGSGRSVSRKLVFSRVASGSLYAESRDTRSNVIITEYEAEAPEGSSGSPESSEPPANPLLLLLEEGWMKSDGSQPEEGGFLTLMLGKVMRANDLDCWPA